MNVSRYVLAGRAPVGKGPRHGFLSRRHERSVVTGNDRRSRVAQIHDHLTATQELPVDRTASRWIGEAEAVTADLVGADVSEDVLCERLGHVRELLANVEETEHLAADEHVADARQITADLLDRLDDE